MVLPSRRLQGREGGRTCGRCRWWQRCRRRWCRGSPSTTAAAAQGPFSCDCLPLPHFHLSGSQHCHVSPGNACCRGSSSHCLERKHINQSVGFCSFCASAVHSRCPYAYSQVSGSYHMDTEGWTGLRYCILHGRICHYSDTCQIHQSQRGLVSEMENLSRTRWISSLISVERRIDME